MAKPSVPIVKRQGQINDTIPFPLNSTVQHKLYGTGIVTGVKDPNVTVLFDSGLTKVFNIDMCLANKLMVVIAHRSK